MDRIYGELHQIEDETVQKTMRTSENEYSNQELNVDSKIAYYLYNYLIGRTNKVPIYEAVERTMQKSKNSAVSVACGLTLRDNYTILVDEPISENRTKITFISENDTYTFIQLVNNNAQSTEQIDCPYDKSKVEDIQGYLTGLHKHMSKNEEKTNSKVI